MEKFYKARFVQFKLRTRGTNDSHILDKQELPVTTIPENETHPIHLQVSNSKQFIAPLNEWLMLKTNRQMNQIVTEEMVSPLEDLAIFLANTIHFKASWLHKFPTGKQLSKNTFYYHGQKEQKISVPFMTVTNYFNYRSLKSADYDDELDDNLTRLNCRMIKMPFALKEIEIAFTMIIVVPNKKNGLGKLI